MHERIAQISIDLHFDLFNIFISNRLKDYFSGTHVFAFNYTYPLVKHVLRNAITKLLRYQLVILSLSKEQHG